MDLYIKGAKIFNEDFELVEGDIAVENGIISAIYTDNKPSVCESDCRILDFTGNDAIISPGFIDMHIHGFKGGDSSNGIEEELRTMARGLIKHGVTSFCPTTMTLPLERLKEVMAVISEVIDKDDIYDGAYVNGIYMEGPYFSAGKIGAQNPQYITSPDFNSFLDLYNSTNKAIKVVAIAPEIDGATEFIKKASKLCTISLAHTSASYETIMASFDAGISHATHLYNAMSSFSHREPGAVGAVLDYKKASAELICDGHHVHPAALRLAFSVLGENNTVIVSDAMSGADMPDGEYSLGGLGVTIGGGVARIANGALAGSISNLHTEVKNALNFGIPLKQVIKSVTINPAKKLGIAHLTGSIKEGKYSDLTVLDKNMEIISVIAKGRIII
ncbi:MAG: N-acetylglucosamine-6-phosphate deacetylase [Clostridiales bacterium]|nr:N-acetylglucosamine-6-phosphate deacetylase [Clostridiales bacterium]